MSVLRVTRKLDLRAGDFLDGICLLAFVVVEAVLAETKRAVADPRAERIILEVCIRHPVVVAELVTDELTFCEIYSAVLLRHRSLRYNLAIDSI